MIGLYSPLSLRILFQKRLSNISINTGSSLSLFLLHFVHLYIVPIFPKLSPIPIKMSVPYRIRNFLCRYLILKAPITSTFLCHLSQIFLNLLSPVKIFFGHTLAAFCKKCITYYAFFHLVYILAVFIVDLKDFFNFIIQQ